MFSSQDRNPILTVPQWVLCPTAVGRVFDNCQTRVRQLSDARPTTVGHKVSRNASKKTVKQ